MRKNKSYKGNPELPYFSRTPPEAVRVKRCLQSPKEKLLPTQNSIPH